MLFWCAHLKARRISSDFTFLPYFSHCVFFFQAEDGIRDHCVTGVQTCALPISPGRRRSSPHSCWPIWNGGERIITLCAPIQRCEWHSCSLENEGATGWRNAIGNGLQPWQREEPSDDGRRARCSLAPCLRFPLESHSSQMRW